MPDLNKLIEFVRAYDALLAFYIHELPVEILEEREVAVAKARAACGVMPEETQ